VGQLWRWRQQRKVHSLITRFCHERGYVVNVPRGPDHDTYDGAIVIPPVPGFYRDDAIIVLDFKSLYPSIIRAYRPCPSSLVMTPEDMAHARGQRHETRQTPSGTFTFVQHVPSITEQIETSLLTTRAEIKRAMKTERDPVRRGMLDAKQKARKIVCNAVYGFYGVNQSMAKVPCLAVSAYVTARGGQMIMETISILEQRYGGINAKVIYGDTDSVFVRCDTARLSPGETEVSRRERIFALGAVAARLAHSLGPAAQWESVIELEFEKIYAPLLLGVKKKQYAGLEFSGHPRNEGAVHVTGFALMRTDACGFTKAFLDCIMVPLLRDRNIEGTACAIRAQCARFAAGQFPADAFVHRCKLGAEYKDEAHVQCTVRNKIKARAPGAEPKPGDLVEWVPLYDPSIKGLVGRAEDPAYAARLGLMLDYPYFVGRVRAALAPILSVVPELNLDELLAPLTIKANTLVRGPRDIAASQSAPKRPRHK
jgi:DNA polymerase delta subunit 1